MCYSAVNDWGPDGALHGKGCVIQLHHLQTLGAHLQGRLNACGNRLLSKCLLNDPSAAALVKTADQHLPTSLQAPAQIVNLELAKLQSPVVYLIATPTDSFLLLKSP